EIGGQFLQVNQALCNILGYEKEELLKLSFTEITHLEDLEVTHANVEKSLHGDIDSYQMEKRYIRKDGRAVWVKLSVSIQSDDAGLPQYLIGQIEDITDSKIAKQALKESEEKFRLISTSAKDAIIIIGSTEEITYWNPAAECIFGYKADEVLGKNMHKLITPPRHRDDSHRGFAHFITSGEGPVIGKTLEMTALRKDGEEFPIELSISAFKIKEQWQALGIIRDISERKQSEEQIRQLAYYDTLTNLPNRRLMLDRLNQSVSQAKRYQRSMAVVFLDLDHFKQINDTLGHDVGDELLMVAANRLKACVRSGDIVSRQGGDEFVIVLAEIAHPQDAAVVAEKIVDTLGLPIAIKGHELKITTSIGISVYPINGTDDTQELMKKADMAMYAAKEGGRNGYRFYQNDPIT
ncbi:MAG: diguanylate cyclase, partial [Sulfuricella sp.]|nr:diguanylate cyclase [Sulfuricella sp.]